jgi:hypothetical protein
MTSLPGFSTTAAFIVLAMFFSFDY